MLRLQRMSLSLLVPLAILAIAGPAAAHLASSAPPAVVLPTPDAPAIIPVLSAAPAPPALPWYLPAALVLAALTVWRRPRRVLVLTLALLLCVFAFENALHSVHHGFDP